MILTREEKTEMERVVKTLLSSWIAPVNRSIRRPFVQHRTYRGKRQYVIGYDWQKSGASRIAGVVYESVIGWGDTFDQAVSKAKVKLGTHKRSSTREEEQTPTKTGRREPSGNANEGEELLNLPLTKRELELVFSVFNSDCDNGSGENDPAFYGVRDKAQALLRS